MLDIKKRLALAELKQVWLIRQIYERYGLIVSQSEMSSFLSGTLKTPKAKTVLSLCNELLKEVEQDGNEKT